MIFLSHNHKDKAAVEPFAERLRSTFGQDKVFYDSWSIQPGDGIVDKMNSGLEACELFLFFVSANSLKSKMVELEWQNAIILASKGKTKLVPVRLDQEAMPAILSQTVYIDAFAHGLEIALRQVIDVATGKNVYQAMAPFQNLAAELNQAGSQKVLLIRALHFMEPNPRFILVSHHAKADFNVMAANSPFTETNFIAGVASSPSGSANAHLAGVQKALTPTLPLRLNINPAAGVILKILAVLHEKGENDWRDVPLKSTGGPL